MAKKIKKHSGGSPETNIDLRQLELLLQVDPAISYVADMFKCSKRAVERCIRKHYDMTFREYKEVRLEHTIVAAKKKAISEALGQNDRKEVNTVLLKLVLKNLCGWSDKHEIKGEFEIRSVTDLLLSADKEMLDVTDSVLKLEAGQDEDDEDE